MVVVVQKSCWLTMKIMFSFEVLLLFWCVQIDGQNFDILDQLLSQDLPSSPLTITIVDDKYLQSSQSLSPSPSVNAQQIAPASEISNSIDEQLIAGSSEDDEYVQQDITELLFQTLNANSNQQLSPTNNETREFKSTCPNQPDQ
eukprot:TRINITY_DN2922_c1_g1_i1.p1 TRINITY_DN2922_c1_g1~~TRINITY_DN2922_c1_g1_i1.p1  ORF type:complete len:144 (+),score=15.61 TRINITY_DN2922_c1_g1_i1:379-810(+)